MSRRRRPLKAARQGLLGGQSRERWDRLLCGPTGTTGTVRSSASSVALVNPEYMVVLRVAVVTFVALLVFSFAVLSGDQASVQVASVPSELALADIPSEFPV